MRQKIVITKLLQSVTSLLKSVSGIKNCDRLLLQSASSIKKCDSYYKGKRNRTIQQIVISKKFLYQFPLQTKLHLQIPR